MQAIPADFKPLTGTDEATIDEKGRVLIGKKKRERLGEPFAISIGPRGCLEAYPDDVWRRKVSEMLQHDTSNLGRDLYTRLIMGSSDDDLRFDAQGRVVVPQKLREAAGLTDKVVLVGCGDRLEIWAKAEHDKFVADPINYRREQWETIASARAQMVGE